MHAFRITIAAVLMSSSIAWGRDDPKDLPGRLGATRGCEGDVLLVGPSMDDCDAKDGASPLVLEWEARKGDAGSEYKLYFQSFDLPEGKGRPYVIMVSLE